MAKQAADVEVRGIRELAAGMAQLASNIQEQSRPELDRVAQQTVQAVRARVPKRSGRLAASVQAQMTEQGSSVGMGAGVPYAGWIEYGGTRGRGYVPGGRYLTPTAQAQGPLLQAAGERAARTEIGKMRWPRPVL